MAEDEPPNEEYLLTSVYVKMEIVEDGVVEGIEDNWDGNSTVNNTESLQTSETQKKSPRKRKKPEVNLSCDQCDYKTAYKSCLKYHKMKHTNTTLSCKFCSYTTKYPASLQRHTISLHKDTTNLPTFKCTECSYESIFKSNLSGHMRKHSTDKKYKCERCDYATAYSILLVKHNRVHHTDEKRVKNSFQCHLCSFQASAEGYLVRHLAKIHKEVADKTVKCDFCSFITKTRWRLTIHRKRSYQNVQLNCFPCNFATNYACEFRMHKNSHDLKKSQKNSERIPLLQQNESNIHKKTEIGTDSIQPNNLNENTHFNFKQLNEINTGATNLNSQSSFQTEINRNFFQIYDQRIQNYKPTDCLDWRDIPVNIVGEERPYLCTVCDYSSKFKAAVQRHFQRHHMANTKPYKCVNCDFSTKTKDQIGLHNKRSKSDSLQCCTTCQFSTFFKCQLAMHQKTHYAYKCDMCDYSCRQSYYIQKHYLNAHNSHFNRNELT